LERWHARLDECGFSIATGLYMAVAASSRIDETPEPSGVAAIS